MGRFLIGLVLGIILVPVCVLLYFKMGRVPVAVNDPPFPSERLVTSFPLNARIDRGDDAHKNALTGLHVVADDSQYTESIRLARQRDVEISCVELK